MKNPFQFFRKPNTPCVPVCMPVCNLFSTVIVAAVLLLGASQSSLAVSGTWSSTAATGAWATSGNWTGGVPGSADTATFNSNSTNLTIDMGAGVTVKTFNFTGAPTGAYIIGSGAVGSQTFTLADSGAITVAGTVVQTELFNANIILGTTATAKNFTLTNDSIASGKSLTIAGTITGLAGAGNKTIVIAGAGNTNLSGVVGDAPSGGAKVLFSKTESGTLTFNGSAVNTFTGGITVSGGTVALDFANLATPTNLVNSANALTLSGAVLTPNATLSIIGKSSGDTAQTFASMAIGSGVNTISLTPNGAGTTTLTITSATPTRTANKGSSLNFQIPTNGAVAWN
ncbi:MAG: autotransporter-associated beta strand repeat-containing protein, partial [Verrucomicrobia bacterium]|nr:autotransporter-associated beta strand repeat-containing protein [Verrucomicrobiota bacterium]